MKVYIAGPYTNPDPCINTRNAILAAEEVVKLGHTPFVPHLTHLWHLISPHDIEFWYEYDFKWLLSCDALLRLPGKSTGADNEVSFADKHNIPVFCSIDALPESTEDLREVII